jgi:hypothetical protein
MPKAASDLSRRPGFNPAYMQKPYEMSGNTCWIKLFKEEGTEPKEPFFGLNFYQITIKRDRWVEVPVEMADHIESLKTRVREDDPEHPDDPDRFIWVDKDRFPCQRSETEPPEVKRAREENEAKKKAAAKALAEA